MRNRLVVAIVGVVALVLAVHDIPISNYLEGVERDRLATRLERDAFIIAGRAEESLEDGVAASDTGIAAMVDRYAVEEQLRVVIVDDAGEGVAGSEPGTIGQDFGNRDEIAEALTSGNPNTGERFSNTLGEDLYFVTVPVLSGDDVVGAVRISAPERVVSDRVANRQRGLLGVALISLAIAAAVAWLLARSITRPLRRLEATTAELAGGDLTARADIDDGPAEIRSLAGSVNSMASRLGQLVARQREFAGTASHQLRTPLTALRLRLEQLQREPDGGGADRGEVVDAAIAETDRLRRMIEGLLLLSRAEDTAVGPTTVDLAAIVRDRAEYWRALADEQRVTIDSTTPAVASVLAVPGAVEQIIDNLVDNALEVSPAGTQLIIGVTAVAPRIELHVVDQGPGLSEAEREHAFDRFWRGEQAEPGGSGLGLAIVRQLAEAGGGSAELRAAPSGGIDAVVSFVPA